MVTRRPKPTFAPFSFFLSIALLLAGCTASEIIGYRDSDSRISSSGTETDTRNPLPEDTGSENAGKDTATVGDTAPSNNTDTIASTDTGIPKDSETLTDTEPAIDTESDGSGSDTAVDPCSHPTMYVNGRHLYDTCGNRIIPIGVNEMVVWNTTDRGGGAIFPEIKKTGANATRFAWSTGPPLGDTPASIDDLDRAVTNCTRQRMLAIPEIHEYDRGNIGLVSQIVDWWIRPEVVDIIAKHQRHLLITIANGAGNDTVTSDRFIEVYGDAISRMRNAGITVPLIVEASGSGGDIDMLLETHDTLSAMDELHNLMFSLHIWWTAPDGSTDLIARALQSAADAEMPLIISEFAPFDGRCEQYIDIDTLMGECVRHGYGFFPWTWGWVNDGDCSYLGMTTDGIYGNWQDTPLSGTWGEWVAVTSPYSIQKQAVEVSSFSVSQNP